MESTVISVIFRMFAAVVSIILLAVSYLIYKNTRGATKGWFYLSWFGFSLFFWSSSSVLFKLLELHTFRYITGAIFLVNIGISVILAYSTLADDFWLQKPKFVSRNYAISAYFLLFFLLIIGNIIVFSDDFRTHLLVKILSLSHQMVGIAFIIGVFPTFYLWLRSKDIKWGAALLAMILGALSMMSGQYYDNCCGEKGMIAGTGGCVGYDLDYIRVYEAPCNEGIISIAKYYQFGLIMAIIIITFSFFLVLRSLQPSEK